MVNLNPDRIARTTIGKQAPSLNEIASTLADAKPTGNVRAKADGEGGVVVYGHKGGFRSLFQKANPQREVAGTQMVARSVQDYVRDKGPQMQERAAKLLEPFYDKEAKAWKSMTNQQVLDIKNKLDTFEENMAPVSKFTEDLRDDRDLTNLFQNNTRLLGELVQVGHKVGARAENRKAWAGVPAPELGAGMMLAMLDDLNEDSWKSGINNKALDPFTMAGGNDYIIAQNNIILDYKNDKDFDGFLSKYCDLAYNRFFSTQSFSDWNKQYAETHPKVDTPRTPNDMRAPMFISDEEARAELVGFDKASGSEKLQMLKHAFEKHMNAPHGDEPRDPVNVNPHERFGLDNRGTGITPLQALANGIDRFGSVIMV